jgi:hypothetical protein
MKFGSRLSLLKIGGDPARQPDNTVPRWRGWHAFRKAVAQATSKTKRLAQDKLVDAILPSGSLSASKSSLIQ